MAVRSPQDIYARHVSSSRGYPMWTPEPSSQLLSHRPEGLKIGDVGVVVPESGSFDVFFNICLPKDHRFHQATGVPDGFSSIELSDADIKTIPNVESADQVLTNSSVTRVGSDAASFPPGTGQYSFNLSSSEGALLVLPEGADRHDICNPRPFFEQASRHAAAWYHFAEENLGRIISHDAIYLITGFYKARSWGLAAYQNEQDNGDFPAQFIVGAREGENLAASYSWETARNMDWRTGPLDGLGTSNQSVFIRGFKIALRSTVQGVPQRWIHFEPNRPDVRPDHGTSSADSWVANIWRGISKTLGVSNEGADQTEGRDSSEDVGVRIEIQRVPEVSPIFHPSDVINRYILQKEPSARIAITHDNDWGSIIDENLLKPLDIAQDELLTKGVSERYTIVSREGVAHLEIKNGPGTPIDYTATETARRAPIRETREPTEVKNDVVQPSNLEPLSVVSESNYRCIDESASRSIASESCPANLHSIPSEFGAAPGVDAPISPESVRPIKVIVISDYICSFCYICDKVLRDAMAACQDLPVRFDVEFRPFTLLKSSASPADPTQAIRRNAYVVKRFGKEQAKIKLMAVSEFAQKAGLKLAEDSIICGTTQAHRLSAKAYQDGGQSLQNKLNAYIFDACLAKGANISDEGLLVDAAVDIGLMNKDEATEFLHSAECLDCVEKMVEAAKAQGINGVPFVIIDGKWAVNGLQPMECFIQIFRKLARLPAPLPVPGKPKTEHELNVH